MVGQLDSGDPGSRHSSGGGCYKGAEVFGGHHEGVAEDAEVCAIAHFFGEDVAENFRTFVTSSSVWMSASWVSGIQLPQP